MTRSLRTLLATVALAGVLLGAAGCSDEPITSSTGPLSIRYVPEPTGTGRYETAGFTIIQITFVPTDPDRLLALHGQSLAFRFGTFDTNLAATASVEFTKTALAPGTYRIDHFAFFPPFLSDSNLPATPASCIEKISSLPSGPAAPQVPPQYTLDSSAGYGFTIKSGQTKLDIVVDVPGLIAGYESSFTCSDDCGGGNACLTAFDADAFQTQFINHVTFR